VSARYFGQSRKNSASAGASEAPWAMRSVDFAGPGPAAAPVPGAAGLVFGGVSL